MDPLPPGAQAIQTWLDEHQPGLRVQLMPASTRTAPEAAAAIGCQVAQIAKSLVFRGAHTGRPVLVITSGANRVDEARLAALLGEPVEKARADYVQEHTGSPIGGVAPVGHPRPLRTLIDQDLLRHGEIWAAAGHPHAVFGLAPAQLVALTGGTVAEIARTEG